LSTDRHPLDGGGLFPPTGRHPYYIVAPAYTRFSAGVRALHLLCHALNLQGQSAFLLIHRRQPEGAPAVDPELLTPRLTDDIVRHHHEGGITPITVYPETITGNPFRAPFVVRYVLNYPGLLGGDRVYARDEMVYGYSATLAEAAGHPEKVLFLPVSDTRYFYPPKAEAPRSGACYYAQKYSVLHPEDNLSDGSRGFEITREFSLRELGDIFRRVELLYCYENSSTALEATLCGCPVVLIPNRHLTERIGAEVVGWDGYAWGDTPEEIERAKATVGQAGENYRDAQREFWRRLDEFISDTQAEAARRPLGDRMRTPLPHAGRWRHVVIRTWDQLEDAYSNGGFRGLIRRCKRRVNNIRWYLKRKLR